VSYCRTFSVRAIRVELKTAGYAILMHPNYFDSGSNTFVVYADPGKLRPYVEARIAATPDWYHTDGYKRHASRKGLLNAKTDVTTAPTIVIPDANSLPMPHAGGYMREEKFNWRFAGRDWEATKEVFDIGYTNGVTRSMALLEAGAEFIPIETSRNIDLLQSHVGTRPPEPVAAFIVTEEERQAAFAAYRACHPPGRW
jgi:hypothetical protein